MFGCISSVVWPFNFYKMKTYLWSHKSLPHLKGWHIYVEMIVHVVGKLLYQNKKQCISKELISNPVLIVPEKNLFRNGKYDKFEF